MATRPSYPLELDGPIVGRFKEVAADGDGLVTIKLREQLHLMVTSPVIGGIRLLDGDVDFVPNDQDQEVLLLLSSSVPGGSLLVHESLVVSAEYRLDVFGGVDGGTDARPFWIAYRQAGGNYRWRTPNWSI